jgi:hypothetical protein
VQLNPRNMDALSDLFEYYLEAPGFMGGGLDKAVGVADQWRPSIPSKGNGRRPAWPRRKRNSAARRSIAARRGVAPHQASRIDRSGQVPGQAGPLSGKRSEFPQGGEDRAQQPQVIYARADTYIEQGRNLETARKLLERYLQAQLTPDDPPRAAAEKLLKKASGG